MMIKEMFKKEAVVRCGLSQIELSDATAFIHSIRSDIYMIEISYAGVSQWLNNGFEEKPARFHSLSEAKEQVKKLGVRQINLEVSAPFDEMIGLASCS